MLSKIIVASEIQAYREEKTNDVVVKIRGVETFRLTVSAAEALQIQINDALLGFEAPKNNPHKSVKPRKDLRSSKQV